MTVTTPNPIPTILLYHKLHANPNWWFTMTDKDFTYCPHKCQVINDRERFNDADMVLFEAPRFVKKQVGSTIYLEYFRWGQIINSNDLKDLVLRQATTVENVLYNAMGSLTKQR